jgi:hypothetical protein
MTFNQFCRLANQFAELPATTRTTIELMAAGDETAAAAAAGGRGSDCWWSAEFFVKALADHGATPPAKFSPAARQPRTMALFAD